MIDRGPAPTTPLQDALRSTRARAERDRQLAAWCGLAPDEVEPFLARLRLFDARTPAWEAKQAAEQRWRQVHRLAEIEDSREGMLIRIDAVIADLVDQLGGQVEPWPSAAQDVVGPAGKSGGAA